MVRVLYTIVLVSLLGASAIVAMDIDSRRNHVPGNVNILFYM